MVRLSAFSGASHTTRHCITADIPPIGNQSARIFGSIFRKLTGRFRFLVGQTELQTPAEDITLINFLLYKPDARSIDQQSMENAGHITPLPTVFEPIPLQAEKSHLKSILALKYRRTICHLWSMNSRPLTIVLFNLRASVPYRILASRPQHDLTILE